MNKQTLVFFNLLRKNTNRRRQQNLARLKKATKQHKIILKLNLATRNPI